MIRSGRLPKIHKSNTIHHVMMRGNNRQNIFFSDDFFEHFLEIVDQSLEKFDHKILSYCLMTNHIHLIVRINNSSLPTVMQNINFRYAKWANRQKKSIGHLFQARYHSLLVSNENYLINLCRYIHLNPVAAKIVIDPLDYKWTSHRNYITCDAPAWLDIDTIKQTIEHKTQQNYIDFISEPLEKEKWKPALYYSKTGMILIDDALINTANSISYEIKSRKKISPDYVASTICGILNFNQEKLYTSYKNHHTSKIRALIASYWLKYSGLRLSEAATVFERAASTLHKQIFQLTSSDNKYFNRDQLQEIDEAIKKQIDLID